MIDPPADTPRAEAAPQDADALPARLRAQRLAHHLTVAELAQRTGLSVGAIRRLERGQRRRITLTLLQALARGLDMMPEELLGVSTRPGILDVRPLLRLPAPARTVIAALLQDMADGLKAYRVQEDAADAGEAP